MRRWILASSHLAALAMSLALASSARTDDGGIEAVGGAVRAMHAYPTISMEYEFVRVHVRPDEVAVECEFVLQNRGPAVHATVGFPSRSSGADAQRSVPFRSFRSFVDGVPVAVHELPDSSRQSDENYGSWWVKEVAFERDQRRTLREIYVAEPGSSYPDHHWFEYVLETGATWAGPIGSGDIVVTYQGIPAESLTDASPKPTSRSPGELRWHFTNLEPAFDSGWQTISVGWKK